jgi:hypothetical protein
MYQSTKRICAGLLLAATISSFALAARPLSKGEVSERAKKALVTNFPNAESINWAESKTGNSFTAYFRLFDVKTVASFDKDGQIISVLRYYKEDRLPLPVLTLIKSKYGDKKIAGVTEFSKDQDVAYYVKLEDNARWYTVRVIGNDMQETERLDKQ